MDKRELAGMAFEEIEDAVKELGESRFRAKQIYNWIMRSRRFDEMSNLSKALRVKLSEQFIDQGVTIRESYLSKIDETEKFLYELKDGNLIEGVLMRYHHGDTLCVSTQVGCRMGCAFCASTLDGCVRDLTAGEILGQVLAANRHEQDKDPDRRVHNIVLMGSGEPLDNYDNVMRFLRLVNDERGLNISLRNISLSTCGLVPKMYRLSEEGLPVTLSVSLHAPNDEVRKKLMPVANSYAIEDVIKACRHYVDKTGRRVIFEYALVGDVNCALPMADELSRLLRGLQCHVNLIPLNEVKERSLRAPTTSEVEAFMERLKANGTSVTRRREMGDDINGACGQLRKHVLDEANKKEE